MHIPIEISERKLSGEERQELLKRYHLEGDRQARQELIEGNLGLVTFVLHKYPNYDEEMFSVGCIGLMKAIDRFDIRKNVKFSTYAVPYIHGEIQREFRETQKGGLSRKQFRLISTFSSFKKDYPNKSKEEICKIADINIKELSRALDFYDTCSLNSIVFSNEDGEKEFIETVGSEDDTNSIILDDLLKCLTVEQKEMLLSCEIKGIGQREIAEEYGVSQGQVSRIVKRSIEKVRKYVRGEIDRDILLGLVQNGLPLKDCVKKHIDIMSSEIVIEYIKSGQIELEKYPLNEKEEEILELASQGLSNEEISHIQDCRKDTSATRKYQGVAKIKSSLERSINLE